MTDHGPTSEYEVIWRNGHIDHVHAHQVMWDDGMSLLAGFGSFNTPPKPTRVKFHAEIDGRWTLLLDVLQDEISSIRNVTHVPDVA